MGRGMLSKHTFLVYPTKSYYNLRLSQIYDLSLQLIFVSDAKVANCYKMWSYSVGFLSVIHKEKQWKERKYIYSLDILFISVMVHISMLFISNSSYVVTKLREFHLVVSVVSICWGYYAE